MIRYVLIFLIGSFAFPAWAVDSYRYLHVTIDTPWSIFIFLLPFVLAPFLLMIILYWRHAVKKGKEKNSSTDVGTRKGD